VGIAGCSARLPQRGLTAQEVLLVRYAPLLLTPILAWSLAPPARASSVVPLSFEDLVGGARTIVRAEVVDVRAERMIGRAGIETIVTFRIERTLKGSPDRSLVSLRFLGGAIGDEAMEVPGMPRFSVGDRDVLCVGDEAGVVSPIVGLMQGRFRVVRGIDGIDRVTLHDGTAFSTTAEVLRPLRESALPIRTMTLSQFESEIGRVVVSSETGRQP
jgi:hypothetical protein